MINVILRLWNFHVIFLILQSFIVKKIKKKNRLRSKRLVYCIQVIVKSYLDFKAI